MDVRNPRNGEANVCKGPTAIVDVVYASDLLRSGQPLWGDLSWQRRVEILERWLEIVSSDLEVVSALSVDTGRHHLAAGEISGAAFALTHLASFAREVFADSGNAVLAADSDVTYTTHLFPYQLVGVISPWNFPLLLSLLDSLAALVAGSAVLVKPSEVTSRFVEPLQKTIDSIPELRAVFKFVVGDGSIGTELIENVDTICFTGSVSTGRKVAAAAASNMIPAHLELGGKDPVVVLKSADPKSAAIKILRASVQATGQACQSLERVYVDRSIYSEFLEALVLEANRVELNTDDNNHGHLGPIIMEGQATIISNQIDSAVVQGAKIETGGVIEHHGGGLWMRPTVLTGVTHDMDLMNKETFGPVLPVMAFDSVAEAVLLANDSKFGLSASVFGDLTDASEVAAQINAGAVSINDGGMTTIAFEVEIDSFGESGLGSSRMGASGLRRFLRRKALITRHSGGLDIDSIREGQD
jgi:succinate-semialdehyde dehydrogenase / glutarate-semialdehyde dehydrogenase